MSASDPRSPRAGAPGVSRARGERMALDPAVVARLAHLDVRARVVVEGFIAGHAPEPVPRLQRRVRRAPPVHARRSAQEPRLEGVGAQRPAPHQAVHRGDQPALPPAARPLGLDGLPLAARADEQDRLRALAGRGARLPHAAAAGRGRRAAVRRPSAALTCRRARCARHLDVMPDARLGAPEPQGRTRLGPALHELAERIKRRGLVVLCSDLMDKPADVLLGLQHFRHRHHEVVVFHILDPDEVEFPTPTPPPSWTSRAAIASPPSRGRSRRRYRERLAAWSGHYQRACRENRIDYVRLDTRTPFDQRAARVPREARETAVTLRIAAAGAVMLRAWALLRGLSALDRPRPALVRPRIVTCAK